MRFHTRRRRLLVATAGASLALASLAAVATLPASAASTTQASGLTISSTGLPDGAIKHVWLIILENKSYDATFTGLNKNSYLWQQLPKQGVLLKNYYGTGHFSQDNYVSMVSGQAPEPDTQFDCGISYDDFGSNASIETTGGSVRANPNFGQVDSLAGANGAYGSNGCVYPRNTPTLFNQLDAAGKTWKGYAQDLHRQSGREAATCGGPGTAANDPTTNPTQVSNPGAYPGVVSFTGAQPNDQYVAKHFPFPWFHSLIDHKSTTPANGGTDCDANHISNLDNPTHGLFHDLQSEATTPAFSWITPDNCSDAHDAVCKGNNLSGAFNDDGSPDYTGTDNNPERAKPTNFTGGLYASDLFLKYYIPMIEQSAAFKDGGLIDITFDEANPPFTYTGNSFNNADDYGPTRSDKANAASGLEADRAGENINGKNVYREPTGPNTPLATNDHGQQLYPGPGDNAFIDRAPSCTSTDPDQPAGCIPDIVRGGAGSVPGERTDIVSTALRSQVYDQSIVATDLGRTVTDTADSPSPIPPNSFVGQVLDSGPVDAPTNSSPVTVGRFQLVDANGTPVLPSGPIHSVTLGARTPDTDPLYDEDDATPGGGDTGSVLISPYITPGSTSGKFYNHYSWLRTMEDLFDVSQGTSADPLNPGAGSISGGLDGAGHLGFAAQPGLAGFGPDVFNKPDGVAPASSSGAPSAARTSHPDAAGPVAPLAGGSAVALVAGVPLLRRRRRRLATTPTSA